MGDIAKDLMNGIGKSLNDAANGINKTALEMYEAAQKYTPNDAVRGAQEAFKNTGIPNALKGINDSPVMAPSKAILNTFGDIQKTLDNAVAGALNSNPAVKNMVGEAAKATDKLLNQIGNQTFAKTAEGLVNGIRTDVNNYQQFVKQEYNASKNAENPAAPAGQLAQSFVRAENLIGQKGVEGAVNQVITNTTEMLRNFNQQNTPTR
jgi:hypothetical protein